MLYISLTLITITAKKDRKRTRKILLNVFMQTDRAGNTDDINMESNDLNPSSSFLQEDQDAASGQKRVVVI